MIRRTFRRPRTFLLVAFAPLACTIYTTDVTRTMDGHTEDGRFIEPEAYSWYGRGAYHEARQEWRLAEHAFVAALAFDPASAEIWTRIAAVRCHDSNQDSMGSFDRAEGLDASYAPLHFERARCLLGRGKFEAAERSALRAIELDPNRQETSLLVADIQDARGRHVAARRWRFAHAARWPHGPEVSQGVAATHPSRTRAGRHHALREALERADLDEARRLAVELRIPSGTLAVQAAVLGIDAVALELRSEVLAAEPDNGDALVAGLVTMTDTAFGQALEELSARDSRGTPKVALSPLAVRWVARVLERHGGSEAAMAWLAAVGPLPAPSSPIESELARTLGTLSDTLAAPSPPARQGELGPTVDSRSPASLPK